MKKQLFIIFSIVVLALSEKFLVAGEPVTMIPSNPIDRVTTPVPIEKKLNNNVDFVNILIKTGHFLDKTESALPQPVTGKEALRTGLVCGVGALGVKYALDGTTRSVGTPLMWGVGVGTALTATGFYWWIGKEMKVITGFKVNLEEALEGLEETQELVKKLKENNTAMENKVDQASEVTSKLLKHMKTVKAVTGDNATVARITNQLLVEAERQEGLIQELLLRLPKKDQKNLLKKHSKVQFSNEAEKHHALLKKYNKGKWRWNKVHSYNDIPQEWLENHIFTTPDE